MSSLNKSHDGDYVMHSNEVLLAIPNGVAEMFTMMCYIIMSPAISVIGILTNMINICIYFRHGMDESINISFLTLAATDLAGLLTCIWYGIGISSLMVSRSESGIDYKDIAYITGAYPRVLFSKMTCLITVYIAVERCLCIVASLKVKTMMTPRRTLITLALLYIIGVITNFPVFYLEALYLSPKTDPVYNITYLGMNFRDDYFQVNAVVTFIKASMLLTSFVLIVISTVVISVMLHSKSKWRQTNANQTKTGHQSMSKRDTTVSKTTVLLSAALIVCYIPYTTNVTLMATLDGFVLYGKYNNFFIIMWAFSWLLETLNSTTSIFIYYHVSTKYRKTFKQLFIDYFKHRLSCGENDSR